MVIDLVFIVIEGLDASGKTTQARRLRKYLVNNGSTVYCRFHPEDDNWLGKQARRFLLLEGKKAHFAAAIFYILDVLRSILITPWLQYDYVIFVRYLMGTAYLPKLLSSFVFRFFALILPVPRFTIYLDVTSEEAHRRISERQSQREMFESLDQLVTIRSRALILARSKNWIMINANMSVEQVENNIRNELLFGC